MRPLSLTAAFQLPRWCALCGAPISDAPIPASRGITSAGSPTSEWSSRFCSAPRCTAMTRSAEGARLAARRDVHLRQQLRGDERAVFLPVNQRVTVRATARRRQAFAQHLEQILGEEYDPPAADQTSAERVNLPAPSLADQPAGPTGSSADTDTLRAVRAACGTCRGACCLTGGTRAWISTETVRRVQRTYPHLGRDAIKARYLEQLPPRTYREACVFHAPGGCALEPTLRSDICHRFLCDGATELVHLVASHAGRPVRIAAVADSQVIRQRAISLASDTPRGPGAP